MKKNKRILKRKEQGITLIALVITIIVLLILAGVSIAMLTGENGILTQAQRAKEETEEAQANEENILNSYEDYLSQATNGGFVESKGVNAPVLGENMELVSYDESTKTWVTNNSSSNYDYVAGTGEEDNNSSRWANAVVTIDGVESYFVWIPRYAYKITYDNPEDISQGGTIDVKFLKGTSNIAADGTVCKYADDSTLNKEEDYIIHPAFTSNVDLGGWRNEVTGIWIGKYESSLVNKSDSSNIITNDEETGNILLSDEKNMNKAIAVQPGFSSWRYITISNAYTNSKAYAENLNSHMLKNSEWGAVAYLTHSQYGRNGYEIDENENSSYITANGNSIIDNIGQSSTGNVYGVYDLSGCANEYVAAYYSGSESNNLIDYGVAFVNKEGTSTEYATAYDGNKVSIDYKYGDATYETSGWNEDSAYFIESNSPFFNRGGSYGNNLGTGIFYFYYNPGSSNIYRAFRICLN